MISPPVFISWKAPPLQLLPRRPAPILDETLDSYLNRLATANHLEPSSLRELLSGSRLKSVPVPPHRLARLTGYPQRSLRYAILELCTPDELGSMKLDGRPRPGEAHQCRSFCGSCLLKHDVSPNNGSPVRWHHFEDVICWRHRRWIAFSGETAEPQPRLHHVEDVLHANRQHRRLCRRYGRKALMTAFHDADYIFSSWTSAGRHQERFGKRMVTLAGQDWKLTTNQHGPAQAAGRYPPGRCPHPSACHACLASPRPVAEARHDLQRRAGPPRGDPANGRPRLCQARPELERFSKRRALSMD
ncbi:hypothetical protein ETD85_60800 [Nonomuraea zeae]|uniref:TniQ domain-containing protein n=1 Tax=Nonomuraea zeae TaxID=1642303 RepID=A0A5S4F1Z3_9ACTN|nr:hypothetical protein ETD85_60800 [Nonomuraea zeae]